MLPSVARWQTALVERVTIAIVVSGSVGDRREWENYGVANVLLDNSGEVIDAFRVLGTPSAVGVWPDGTIAAAPAGALYRPEVLIRILLKGPTAREATSAGAEAVADSALALPVVVRYVPGRP